eukprot:14381075-Alexandrium_andersonii.AAC.1
MGQQPPWQQSLPKRRVGRPLIAFVAPCSDACYYRRTEVTTTGQKSRPPPDRSRRCPEYELTRT